MEGQERWKGRCPRGVYVVGGQPSWEGRRCGRADVLGGHMSLEVIRRGKTDFVLIVTSQCSTATILSS